MLSDFLTLEIYFGSPNAALYFEDLVKKYGQDHAERAIQKGDLYCRCVQYGPDRGRLLTWLSAQGRQEAQRVL